jgi:oxidase EvaA
MNPSEDGIGHVLLWLREKQAAHPGIVEEIGIRDLAQWRVDEKGNITHQSGRFFSIIGVRVTGAGNREVPSWTQPMLKQEECSVSGIIMKRFGGVTKYLFYAKFEPGNIDRVQLSPALQVTESNLDRAHEGKKPPLAEYFDGTKGKVVTSVVGVEDGGRFFHKTNRTMVVEVPEDEEVPVTDEYVWLTLPQIRKLLLVDNVMNSLAREVCAVL